MKKAYLIAVLLTFLLACKNNVETPVPQIQTSTRLINDSVFYVSSPITYRLDVDGDGAGDIQFFRSRDQWQTRLTDSFCIAPMHASVGIATQQQMVYRKRYRTVCMTNGGADSIVYYSFTNCTSGDPQLYDSVQYVVPFTATNTTGGNFTQLTSSVLQISSLRQVANLYAPCNVPSTFLEYGISFGTSSYLFVVMDGKKYAVQVKDKIPYLYFIGVTNL